METKKLFVELIAKGQSSLSRKGNRTKGKGIKTIRVKKHV
jgi:hypothetical protein